MTVKIVNIERPEQEDGTGNGESPDGFVHTLQSLLPKGLTDWLKTQKASKTDWSVCECREA